MARAGEMVTFMEKLVSTICRVAPCKVHHALENSHSRLTQIKERGYIVEIGSRMEECSSGFKVSVLSLRDENIEIAAKAIVENTQRKFGFMIRNVMCSRSSVDGSYEITAWGV